MYTNATEAKESIDKRTIRAATESMSLDRYVGDAGEFDVYSASGSVYRVNVVTGDCECPSAEYQSGACKHVRRVEMELGQRETPDLGKETDVERMIDAHAKRAGAKASDEKEVATDGGVAAETPTRERESKARITGPWTEPLEQGGENYYRCSDCGRESLRRGDLKRGAFHAAGCALR